MSMPSALPRRHFHLTWIERFVVLGTMVLIIMSGTLFASLMPWPRAGLLFATLWGAVLGAITVGLMAMRLQDRMHHVIHTLDRKIAQTPKMPIIPSYPIPPEPLHPPIIPAPHVPIQHTTPAPIPRRAFHTLDELSGETLVDPIPTPQAADNEDQEATLEERQMPTEQLEGFADLPTHEDQEETLNEVARPTQQHVAIPGSVLMSMAEIDAEMTPVHTLSPSAREAQSATRPFITPAPLLTELAAPHEAAHQDVTLQAPAQEHFTNRATIPLDAHVVQSFLSDQRSTQKIENIPDFISQTFKRRKEKEGS